MKCPRCEASIKPTEFDREAELVMYTCTDCFQEWYVSLDQCGEDGLPMVTLSGEGVQWLVTDEHSANQAQVWGWRHAFEAMTAFMQQKIEDVGIHNDEFSHHFEFSASADPEHEGFLYQSNIDIQMTVSSSGRPGSSGPNLSNDEIWHVFLESQWQEEKEHLIFSGPYREARTFMLGANAATRGPADAKVFMADAKEGERAIITPEDLVHLVHE